MVVSQRAAHNVLGSRASRRHGKSVHEARGAALGGRADAQLHLAGGQVALQAEYVARPRFSQRLRTERLLNAQEINSRELTTGIYVDDSRAATSTRQAHHSNSTPG